MPLQFQSVNRGPVAFGFFNIDTDMILLDSYFFFADAFCELVRELAAGWEKAEDFGTQFEAYHIERPEDLGDLSGAIRGVNYQGFIGAVYQDFPFPRTHQEFKQKPDGGKNRSRVEEIIRSYGAKKELPFLFEQRGSHVNIGDYQFDRKSFGQLVRYVWDGGAPGWKNDVRPAYVTEMMQEIARSGNPFFKE